MGLDIVCEDSSARVGSYTNVHLLRYNLLIAVKKYLQNKIKNYKSEISDDQDYQNNEITNNMSDLIIVLPLIAYLDELTENNEINYGAFNKEKNEELGFFDLEGFMSFINHSDCDGVYDDADCFLVTYEIVKEYIDDNYKNEDGDFYLEEVFRKSIDTGNTIYFC